MATGIEDVLSFNFEEGSRSVQREVLLQAQLAAKDTEIAALRAQLEKADALAEAADEELSYKGLTTKIRLVEAAKEYKKLRPVSW